MNTPRGIRNHNPGNLIDLGIDWDGLALPGERTGRQVTEGKFCVFRAPWWGIRAMAKVLQRYYHHYEIRTVAGMVARYAPGHENPTDAYTRMVAKAMGLQPGEVFTMNHYYLATMVESMIGFENGQQPYSWEIVTGLIMAGLEPAAEVQPGGKLHYTFKG